MSAEQRRITLTENDNGYWTAQEEPDGRTASGETPEAALDALDEADEPETAADRLDGFGLFSGEDGEAFAEAVEESRKQFDEDYEERQRDLFGQ
jgi:hypothetical protein